MVFLVNTAKFGRVCIAIRKSGNSKFVKCPSSCAIELFLLWWLKISTKQFHSERWVRCKCEIFAEGKAIDVLMLKDDKKLTCGFNAFNR